MAVAMPVIPVEVSIYGIYFLPLMVAGAVGLVLARLTGSLLNRLRLARWFAHPPLVFVALSVIYTVLLSTFVFPG
ncbi:MAG: DUF1656 domain-containing protein [Woeseiaceae bacterium]|jgi:hypothetical protein|nr:DUF1656 domain-containing protein [Woeseiaceae bacterium]